MKLSYFSNVIINRVFVHCYPTDGSLDVKFNFVVIKLFKKRKQLLFGKFSLLSIICSLKNIAEDVAAFAYILHDFKYIVCLKLNLQFNTLPYKGITKSALKLNTSAK